MTRTIEPYDDSDDEDWDLRDSDGGVTPLHLATRTGDHWRCAIILLAAGAQVDYRCPYFSREFTTSPMDIAIHFRRQHGASRSAEGERAGVQRRVASALG